VDSSFEDYTPTSTGLSTSENDDQQSSQSESHPPSSSFTPSATSSSFSYEDTPLSRYRSEHDRQLDGKSRASEAKRDKIIEDATASISSFYATRDQTKTKVKATNRREETQFISDRDGVLSGTGSKNEWARVATLVDFKSAAIGRDNSRMRKILIDLKQ